MKKLIFLFILLLIAPAFAQPIHRGGMNIEEEDGSPTIFPYKLKVTNTTLTDNGDGTASLDNSGSTTTGWTRSGTNVNLTNVGDNVGVGSAVPVSKLDVQGAIISKGPMHNVLAYGATGDGVTDDTSTIQAAIDAVNSDGGGVVFFPVGIYMTTGLTGYANVILKGQNVSLYDSDDANSTILRKETGASGQLIDITSINGFIVEDIEIDGVDKSVNGIGGNTTTKNVFLNRVRIRDCDKGIDGYWGTSRIYKCNLTDNNYGIYNLVDSIVTENYISDNINDGIYFGTGANENIVSGNKIEWNQGFGMQAYQADNLRIATNIVDRNFEAGVYLNDCDRISVLGNSFERNGATTATDQNKSHLRIEAGNNIVITGNTSQNGKNDDASGNDTPKYGAYIYNATDVSEGGNDWKGINTGIADWRYVYRSTLTNNDFIIHSDVGIGIGSSVPSHNLDVGNVNGTTESSVRVVSGANQNMNFKLMETSDNYGFTIRNNGTDNRLDFIHHENSSAGAIGMSMLRASGNVGIGSAIPTRPLVVQQNNAGEVQLRLGNDATSFWDIGRDGTTGQYNIKDQGGTKRLVINQTSGNVGIGSAVPVAKLDVNGAIRIGGNYTFPTADGTNAQVLKTDGSGVVAWAADDDSGGAPEGTAVLSTGEGGASKFLREDGDGTSSWQAAAGGGDLLANGTVPMTANWDIGNFDITLKALTGDGTIEGATLTEGGTGVHNITQSDAAYQPLEATLTDIADGTIVENLVNTTNPWADNEVSDTLTASLTTVADTADATSFPALFESATGDLAPKTDLGLTYDATAASLATTTFVGALTGNASTATALATARAIGGVNFDGTAAITPTTIVVADTTDTTSFPAMFESATGSLLPKTDGGITYNAGTANLATTTFTGALVGNSTTTTTASAGDAAVDFFGAGVDAVTDATTCTDIEGTALSITAGTLNVTEADPTVDSEAEIEAITGALFGASKVVTAGYVWVADGTDFESVQMTGDVTIASGGATTIGADTVVLTTDTTGNYAAGDAEAGAATSGDAAVDFFGAGVDAVTDATTCTDIEGRSLTIGAGTLDVDAELYTDTKCIWFEDPTAADDLKSIWYAKNAVTLTSIWGESDQTVTFMLQVDDGTPADVDSVDIVPTAGTDDDTALDGDATMAAGDRLDLDLVSVANTPTWCSICWTLTRDD